MSSLSREELAQQEIGHTELTPATAWTLTLAFLATLAVVPAVQLTHELRTLPPSATVPPCCSIVATLPAAVDVFNRTSGSAVHRLLAANAQVLRDIDSYEQQLEDDSLLTRAVLPSTQYVLSRWGRAGNEQAYLGRDGSLFYRPGIDYLTGPGFLEPHVLQRRSLGTEKLQPDPRPAILEFQRQLARRGIQLVLLPAPVKGMLEPEFFSARYASQSNVLQNRSYSQWQRELTEAGVLIFDPAETLLAEKQATGQPQFLQTDTHWTPPALERVAQGLRDFISQHELLPTVTAAGYRAASVEVDGTGDIAVMLKLPARQTLYPPQRVTTRQITTATGELWEPADNADVLLLGDSFTNIYSLAGMQWGESAGLAEQLSFELQRPVDRIAQNDAGAYATRQALALELARGHDRLAGKRLVIWEFAVRELAVGDWRKIDLPAVDQPAVPGPASTHDEWLAHGRVVDAADVPPPGSVPYRDAVTSVHLTDVTGLPASQAGTDAVVYLWGMRDNRLTSAAHLQPGRQLKLKLTPWDQVSDRYGRFTRVELDDPDFTLIDLPNYWAEIIP